MAALARLLVVDDDVGVAEVLQDYFTDEGYEVRIADNGRVALDLFDTWRPHVVLLDLRMPGLTGADVFHRIRAMQPRASVVFVTGADDEGLARQLLREGATDYVRKPIDLDYCALAVLMSVARDAAPGGRVTPETHVQAVYALVRRVRGIDEAASTLRQELEELAHAALRDALAQDPAGAQAQLEVFRTRLEAAGPTAISPSDRAALVQALAAVAPSLHERPQHEESPMPKVKPIPEGHNTVSPYLIVDGAERALAFYTKAFGATELFRHKGPDGKVGHAEIRIGDTIVMLADQHPDHDAYAPGKFGGSPVSLHVYVENVDAVVERARAAGGTVTHPVADQFYGDRNGAIKDPFGHTWHISTHVEDVPMEELSRRAEAAMKERKG